MAFIYCPGCGEKLQHYSIEIVAKEGKLAGRGGIICPACGKSITNAEIEHLFFWQSKPDLGKDKEKVTDLSGLLLLLLIVISFSFWSVVDGLVYKFSNGHYVGLVIFLSCIFILERLLRDKTVKDKPGWGLLFLILLILTIDSCGGIVVGIFYGFKNENLAALAGFVICVLLLALSGKIYKIKYPEN